MTMSEYEERFRTPAPSLHQIFAATRGPNATRRRTRRFWVAASLLGVLTVTMEIASHHTAPVVLVTNRRYASPASDEPHIQSAEQELGSRRAA